MMAASWTNSVAAYTQRAMQAESLSGKRAVLSKMPDGGNPDKNIADYVDVNTGDTYMVDQARNATVYFDDKAAVEHLGKGAVKSKTDAALVKAASDHIKSHLPRWSNARASVSTREMGRSADGKISVQVAEVEFRETVDGIKTCNYASVTVNPQTLEIVSVFQEDGDIAVDTKPSLAESQAIDIAAKAAKMPIHKVETSELMIWRSLEDRKPHLAQHIILSTGTPGTGASVVAYVDMHDGTILNLF
jgi:hypothetical protein